MDREPVIQGVHYVAEGNFCRGLGLPGGGLCVCLVTGIIRHDKVNMDYAETVTFVCEHSSLLSCAAITLGQFVVVGGIAIAGIYFVKWISH